MTARRNVTDTLDRGAGNSSSTSHLMSEPLDLPAGGPPPNLRSQPVRATAGEFLDLRIWAESFHDTQLHRIATVNRMQRGGVDADLLQGHRQMLDASEHAFKLAMVRSYRRVVRAHMPAVEEWQKRSFGIGEHLLARLLGHLGHPVIASPYMWLDEAPDGHRCIEERCGKRHLVALQPYERTVGQLWQYCGHGAPSKRKKGMTQEDAFRLGNPSCKFLVHLLAEATIRISLPETTTDSVAFSAGSPQPDEAPISDLPPVGDKHYYRRVYDTRKATTGDRGWTDGHRHADALRIVGKEILRDLWTNAHPNCDTHLSSGVTGWEAQQGERND